MSKKSGRTGFTVATTVVGAIVGGPVGAAVGTAVGWTAATVGDAMSGASETSEPEICPWCGGEGGSWAERENRGGHPTERWSWYLCKHPSHRA